MTPIHTLSDTQLNEAIAVKKGWTKKNVEPAPFITTWHHENGDIELYCPDFTHDWNLAGALLEEMKGNLHYLHDRKMWKCIVPMYGYLGIHTANADTPQRAICEAYAEWRGK